MSHTYPIAETADEALAGPRQVARTRYEAEALVGTGEIEKLATEWITPEPAELDALMSRIESGPAHGFVQRYEDADGRPVLAVTFWKLGKAGTAGKPIPEPDAEGSAPATEDDTDDLYFKAAPKRRKRKAARDPNQLDLFGKSADKS